NNTVDFSPTWSPDGTRIAFHCDPDGTENLEICVINADGTNLVRLTNNPALDEFPAWSRDGAKILFSSLRNGNSYLFIMNPARADASGVRQEGGRGHPGTPGPRKHAASAAQLRDMSSSALVRWLQGTASRHPPHNESSNASNDRSAASVSR